MGSKRDRGKKMVATEDTKEYKAMAAVVPVALGEKKEPAPEHTALYNRHVEKTAAIFNPPNLRDLIVQSIKINEQLLDHPDFNNMTADNGLAPVQSRINGAVVRLREAVKLMVSEEDK